MPTLNVGTAKLHPMLLGAIIVVAVFVVALVLLVVQQGATPEEVSDTAGTVLAETATPKPASPDADKDGWANIDDPLPNGPNNLDNDRLADEVDSDDDNDGIPDVKDKYPLDQNNNGTPDAAERRVKGERFDGDRDGRPDLGELRKVALAEADKLGLRLSTSILHLADVPAQVFRTLPDGWNFVCQDTDNDGNPNATDRFDHSLGGSYSAYTHDGRWESNYPQLASEGKKYGLIHQWYTGASGSEPPRYDVPAAWANYIPGSTPPGGDPHTSFYGSVPKSEHGQYYVVPGGIMVDQPGSEGLPATEYPGGFTPPPGTYEIPHTESAPPPPPDSGGMH